MKKRLEQETVLYRIVKGKGYLMRTASYNCPCCGGPLAFDGATGKLECAACGNAFEPETLEMLNASECGEQISFERPKESFQEVEEGVRAYVCENCGAELMTENTTTAIECPYCGSPTILPDRIEGSVKPKKVIPFTVTQAQARNQFEEYFKGKRLLPNVFVSSRNRIAEMRRLYVPYWLFSCDARADMVYDAEKVRMEQKGEWEITRTKHYLVRRRGRMRFENIPVDGSVRLDNKITESLEPYDLRAAVPFQSAMLAGAMADHADVDCDSCEKRAVERVEHSVDEIMRDSVTDYDTVKVRTRRIHTEDGWAIPALLPVWLMTTVKEGKTYTFAVNGQTGKLTCDVPADKKKSLLWGLGVFAGALGIGALILALTKALGSGSLLICAVVAAILALAVVGAFKGQLKQAAQRSTAHSYILDGSFHLDIHTDHFLYETTTKRKLESNEQKK